MSVCGDLDFWVDCRIVVPELGNARSSHLLAVEEAVRFVIEKWAIKALQGLCFRSCYACKWWLQHIGWLPTCSTNGGRLQGARTFAGSKRSLEMICWTHCNWPVLQQRFLKHHCCSSMDSAAGRRCCNMRLHPMMAEERRTPRKRVTRSWVEHLWLGKEDV